MVRNTLQAMLCLFCLLWSRIIVGKGCNDKRKSGGVFWEGGLLVSVVDIVYVNLYFMLVCLMTRGEGGECFRRWVGGRATSRVGKVARSWLSPFYSCKIPRLLSQPRYSLVGAHIQQVLTKRKRWGFWVGLWPEGRAYMRHRAHFNDGQFDNGLAHTNA